MRFGLLAGGLAVAAVVALAWLMPPVPPSVPSGPIVGLCCWSSGQASNKSGPALPIFSKDTLDDP